MQITHYSFLGMFARDRFFASGKKSAVLRVLITAATLIVGTFTVQAQFVWTGAESNQWGAAGNWSGGGVPSTHQARAQFGAAGGHSVVEQGLNNLTIGRLEYATGAIARTITGNSITLQGVQEIGLLKEDDGWQTIDAQLRLGSPQKWQINAGVLELNSGVFTPYYMTLTKSGAGTLILNGGSTSSIVWKIQNGAVRLGHSNAMGSSNHNHEVFSGASLEFAGSIDVNQGGIGLAGSGYQGQGVLRNISGDNSLNAQITLNADTRIQSDAGSLTIKGPIDGKRHRIVVGGAGDVHFDNVIRGDNTALTIDSSGTVYLQGNQANVNSGQTIVNSGTLVLDKSDNTNAIAGNLVINGGVVRLAADNQIKDDRDSIVTVNPSGLLDLDNHNTKVHQLVMKEGLVKTGTGTLTINNSGSSSLISRAANTASVIEGHIAFANNGNIPIIQVEEGGAEVDLDLRASLTSTNGFEKTGAGTLRINQEVTTGGTTIWSHPVRITEGTVLLGNSHIMQDTAAIVLNGGRLATGGNSDIMGTLTLTKTSVIDLGHGSSKLHFADSRNQGWTGGQTLYIDSWSGSTAGGGQDQIVFGNNSSALSVKQIDQIVFRNPYGMPPGHYAAMMLASGEIVPVPEPAAVIAVGGLLGLVCWRERKKIRHAMQKLHGLLGR